MQYGGFDPRQEADFHPPPSTLGSVQKNVLLADSDDGGLTWTNVRSGSNLLGEMHGSAVELPDGRIVLMHVHRVPWLHGGERARVSGDGGNSWDEETSTLGGRFRPGRALPREGGEISPSDGTAGPRSAEPVSQRRPGGLISSTTHCGG